jgi:hypothetical protein
VFKSIALRVAGIALAVSLAANGALWYVYRGALLDTERIKTEVVSAANARLTESLSHQATAHEERVAELQRRLELGDQVTKAAQARQEAAQAALTAFRRSQATQAAADAAYEEWARQALPAGVADRLRGLQ